MSSSAPSSAALPATAIYPPAALPAALSAVLTAAAVFCLIVLVIPPGATAARAAALALFAGLVHAFTDNLSLVANRSLIMLAGPAAWNIWLQAVELALVSRASRDDIAAIAGSSSPPSQVWNALCLLCNWRRLGTKWQISRLAGKAPPSPRSSPSVSSSVSPSSSVSAPSSVSSRVRWLCRGVPVMLATYAFLDVVSSAPQPDSAMISPGRQLFLSRLGEITAEEVRFRVMANLFCAAAACMCVIHMYYVFGVFAVATGLSAPSAWPPVWGPISAAYSIRGYWGTFYHQGLRRTITGLSDAFIDRVLRVPRGTLFSRYSRLILAFAISGSFHHMGEIASGVPLREAGQFFFFTSQGFGVMVEDFVGWVYKRTAIRLPQPVERAIGYCWVVAWLVWSMPWWSYPVMRYMTSDGGSITMLAKRMMGV